METGSKDRWKPTDDDLKRIRAAHEQWLAEWAKADFSEKWADQHPQGRANLCNADLSVAKLNKAILFGAELAFALEGGDGCFAAGPGHFHDWR